MLDMFSNVGFYQMAMNGLSARRDATLQNIANQNTPNYKRKYTDFETQLKDILDGNKKIRMRKTHDVHITNPKTPFEAVIKTDKDSYRFDGNSVDIDVENLEIWKTYYKYSAATDFVRKEFERYRSAIQEGGK